MPEVRLYQSSMEEEWVLLRARVAARTHTWDFVERKKVKYDQKSIELVLIEDHHVIGYIDAELESQINQICWNTNSRGAVVQEFGVSPEHQKKGYSRLLLNELAKRVLLENVGRIEFWTKDPQSVLFYQHLKFKEIFHHEHYRIEPKDYSALQNINHCKPIFAYMIKEKSMQNHRSYNTPPYGPHDCVGFEWVLQQIKGL
jgi:GNAT superfamily N-acetyltransferase